MRRFALVVLLFSSRALADDAADVAAARELAIEGVVLADAGKCEAAIDKLARAEKLHHAPTILGRLGECQVNVGKLVEGTENLQRVIREPLGLNPPPPFVAAQARAQKVLTEAQPKIAKLTIFVEPETANVTIDGAAISAAGIGTPRPMDPGPHVIEARAKGHKVYVSTITLTTSQVASVTIKLDAEPEAKEVEVTPPPPPSPEPKKPAPPTPVDAPHTNNTAAYVTLGIGIAGVTVGATFGLMATNRKSALDRDCENKVCSPASQDTLDAAQRYAALSSIGFAVGAAGVIVGGVLLLTAPPPKSAWVAPTLGVGSIGLRGEF